MIKGLWCEQCLDVPRCDKCLCALWTEGAKRRDGQSIKCWVFHNPEYPSQPLTIYASDHDPLVAQSIELFRGKYGGTLHVLPGSWDPCFMQPHTPSLDCLCRPVSMPHGDYLEVQHFTEFDR